MKKIYKFYLVLEQRLVDRYNDVIGLSHHFHSFRDADDVYIILWAWTGEKELAYRYLEEHNKKLILQKSEYYGAANIVDDAIIKSTQLGFHNIDSKGEELELLTTQYEMNFIDDIEMDFNNMLSNIVSENYQVFNDKVISILYDLCYTNLHDFYYSPDKYDEIYSESSPQICPDIFAMYLHKFSFLF